ncbi:MAG: hypothetical protein KC588_02140 [Nitrospira sp.]|nr:hypothetical protein [Nitrospira sp.]
MRTFFILWQDPDSRQWFPVGKLTYSNKVYTFVYTYGAKLSPRFVPLGVMRDLEISYEAEQLFPLFANRLLSRHRPEYKTYLNWLNIQSEPMNPLDELERTGGIRATDSLAVIPCPIPNSEGNFTLTFFGHGIRYLPEQAQQWVTTLKSGRPLYLMFDNQNEQDNLAIAIRTEPVMVVGYLPRYFAEDLRSLMNQVGESVKVWVEKVNLDAPIQLRLLCSMKAKWPENFKSCSGELYTPLTDSPSHVSAHGAYSSIG